MLHNPKWDKSLGDLLGFLEQKPADEVYHWQDAAICACGQFYGYSDWRDENHDFADRTGIDLNQIALGQSEAGAYSGGAGYDRTGKFGDLLRVVKEKVSA